eukprot:12675-Eustigmatos_ZCMA.PRE.1
MLQSSPVVGGVVGAAKTFSPQNIKTSVASYRCLPANIQREVNNSRNQKHHRVPVVGSVVGGVVGSCVGAVQSDKHTKRARITSKPEEAMDTKPHWLK